ncbi:hypothetical protein Pla100_06930 [Neorhodopirellula pilleata]|uniref:Uncharacterized protein n=1 Tax=Neorhodopirellula pilleata TaxID=2714738 RepID=A0A5C6AUS2_9BACT|nr:hypothetical protein Pla100_06930 [Neorhodopirellula pilleata]
MRFDACQRTSNRTMDFGKKQFRPQPNSSRSRQGIHSGTMFTPILARRDPLAKPPRIPQNPLATELPHEIIRPPTHLTEMD